MSQTDMTRHVFAINPRSLGHNPKKYHRGFAEGATAAQITALLGSPELKHDVALVRAGDEAQKDGLLSICPHYSAFRDNHRAQAAILPEAFTFTTCVDVDDLTIVEQAIGSAMAVNQDEQSDWQGQVLYIEYSPRKKCHIWIRIPKGLTIVEAQRAFCEETGIPFDESCLTPERYIFMTGDAVYQAKEWLEPLGEEEVEERREAYLNRGLDVDGRPLVKQGSAQGSAQGTAPQCSAGCAQQGLSPCVAAGERTLYMFDACMKEAGLEPDDLIDEGFRHNGLKAILSVGATQLLSKAELLGVLKERMAQNWQDGNIQTLVNDFYEKYHDESQKLNAFQRKVLAEGRRIDRMAEKAQQASPDSASSAATVMSAARQTAQAPDLQAGSTLADVYASDVPPEMPERLPRLVALLLKNTPPVYRATVAHAIFPSLGAHLCGVQFPYIDNVLHEATLMNVVLAGTGRGKGCIDAPINHIMADIRERDFVNSAREEEFNRENNRRGNNKDKLTRPDDLVIQEIMSDVTHAAFVLRLKEAKGHFLYFKLNEIELFDKLKGTGGQQFVIMCQAFDPGNVYGQTRAGSQSVNARVCIRFNWNASGTVVAVQKYFARHLTKGPISRINFCTIPEREIGDDAPVYGIYDEAFDQALKPYIDNLCNASGITVCKPALRLANRLVEECAEFSRLSQDGVFENLSFRGNVIAYLKACVLYVANGCKWERAIEDFVRWSLHYDLWTKMHYFADGIRHAEQGAEVNTRGPRNLLALLPDEFTYDDAVRVRLKDGKDREGTANMLYQWIYRKYILRLTDYSFKKCKSYG